MSRFYVISPNVDAKGNSQTYLEEMFNKHIILMGWGPEKQFGQMFEKMEIGDYVICAQGANQNKQLFFAGMISSKSSNEWPYSRILTGFVDLREETIEFNSDNAYGNASRIPAIYELKQNNNADYEICNNIKRIVDKMKNEEKIKDYTKLLESNHNLILTGAPGTGKTYLAKQIAKKMECSDDEIGFVQFHPSYDYTDFVEGLRPIQDKNGTVGFERKDGVFKKFCEKALKNFVNDFDTAYDKLITDVKNGTIKEYNAPNSGTLSVKLNNNNVLEYDQKNTDRKKTTQKKYLRILFYKFMNAKTEEIEGFTRDKMENVIKDYFNVNQIDYIQYRWALSKIVENFGSESSRKSFVFIIDEINRGEISKIFGELFFSIDPGYRGAKGKVRTQYANMQSVPNEFDKALEITDPNNYGYFFIPENVYIIGTMNDIDRSVESMDFAFRRRFAFKEIKASENIGMLDELGDLKEEAIIRMNNLNNTIWDEEKKTGIDGLSSAYHIGGSYFLKLNNYDGNSDEKFKKLWDYHIEGLLREYLRGNPEIEKHISKLKTAYQNDKKDVSSENNG